MFSLDMDVCRRVAAKSRLIIHHHTSCDVSIIVLWFWSVKLFSASDLQDHDKISQFNYLNLQFSYHRLCYDSHLLCYLSCDICYLEPEKVRLTFWSKNTLSYITAKCLIFDTYYLYTSHINFFIQLWWREQLVLWHSTDTLV